MIYGSPKDRNIIRLIKWIYRWPILPIFGDGNSMQQPVFVQDVAWSIVNVLSNEKTFYKSYNLSGKKALTYNQVINTIETLLKKKVFKIYFPYKLIFSILNILEKLNIRLSIKSEQILRLNENKAFSHEEAYKDFSYRPLSFKEGVQEEIKLLKEIQ